jgi:hypothetical protein
MKSKKHKRTGGKPTQRETIRDVMLSAAECGAWLTLHELATLTRYAEASISAQLRHLRKPRFGSFRLEKRVRERAETSTRVARHRLLWEYRLRTGQTRHGGRRQLLLERECVAETLS